MTRTKLSSIKYLTRNERLLFNMLRLILVASLCALFCSAEAAKILAVIPTPSVSHQLAFRSFTQELAKRGHEVTVITADPAFEKGKTPPNFREIDVHDISYEIWRSHFLPTSANGHKSDLELQLKIAATLCLDFFVEQLETDEIQTLIKNETFDLLLLEAWVRPALFFTHIYKDIPAIAMSSWGGFFDNYDQIGAAIHPLVYPKSWGQRLNNRTMWDKILELYNYWDFMSFFYKRKEIENKALREFVPDMPDLNELYKNIDMMFFNVHPLWDGNRPVPPSAIFMNGIHKKPHKKLPQKWETYLNSSTNGVIYVSFGTNVSPSMLPSRKLQILTNVFSQMPYDVLWKWDKDELPGRTKNIKIAKWLPQSDLLRHPNIKVFVTQCGLQSTDEAIDAGVPLVGIPMLGDQWHNGERYVQLKIGKIVDMETMDEESLKAALEGVLNDNSYRKNVIKLSSLMSDQPQSGLERAVWWTEHVLRHGGGKHLRAPGANMSWREYLELDLLFTVFGVVSCVVLAVITAVFHVIKIVRSLKLTKEKKS